MSSRRRFMLAVPAAAFAALLLVAPANASTVDIQDEANILNATTVQNEAAALPVPILIWTSTQDATNRSAFDSAVQAKVTSSFPVVLGINPQSHHELIRIGSRAGLSQSAANAAAGSANSAFDNTMKSANNYSSAVNAALTSLNSSLAARNDSGTKKSSGVGTFITIAVIVIALIIIVAVVRRMSRPGRRMGGRVMSGPPMGGFNQGGYGPPPGYGPGYGPGYNQGGMGPGAAGAIGAVGGGLVGYELGKMAGENQQFRQDEMMMGGDRGFDDNQNYGGDQGNDWVVGQDSDFSGGDSGGGGDFGGGDSGGGGGDW
jgi:hypothetical protein